MTSARSMRAWWTADRPVLDAPIPGAVDLGGCFSLNLLLPEGVVLRVHRPYVSRARVVALQAVRSSLVAAGLRVGEPLSVSRRGAGWSERETYVPHGSMAPTWDGYRWLFRSLGLVHRALSSLRVAVPRPAVSTYAPPSTLRRWIAVTEAAVRHDRRAHAVVARAEGLVRLLAGQWIPAAGLPRQLIHGDGKFGNLPPGEDGEPVFLDFGFCAMRPRVHDLAHSLAWMVLRPDDSGRPESFAWDRVPELLGEYESAARSRLSALERRALIPYLAAVPLYEPAVVGFKANPAPELLAPAVSAFLDIAEWALAKVRC